VVIIMDRAFASASGVLIQNEPVAGRPIGVVGVQIKPLICESFQAMINAISPASFRQLALPGGAFGSARLRLLSLPVLRCSSWIKARAPQIVGV
jgi:hypothetical protein